MDNSSSLWSDSGYVCGSSVPLAQFVGLTTDMHTLPRLAALWIVVWSSVWYGCVLVAWLLIKYVWRASSVTSENSPVHEGRNLATVVRAVVVAGYAFLVLGRLSLKSSKEFYDPTAYMIASTDAGVFLFWTFDFADLILGVRHGVLGRDMIMHHLVYIAASFVGTGSCFGRGRWSVAACVLLSLEVSTPALTYTVAMRNRLGDEHWSVKLSFLIFGLLFAIFRICLYTFMLTRIYVHFYDATPSEFFMHGYVAAALFACGAALQYYWGFLILKKMIRYAKCGLSQAAAFSVEGTLGSLLIVLLCGLCHAGGFPQGYRSDTGYICGSSGVFPDFVSLGDKEDSYAPRYAYFTAVWAAIWYACVLFVKFFVLKLVPESKVSSENSAFYEGRNLATVLRAFVSFGFGLSVLLDAWQNTPGPYYSPTAYTLRTADIGVLLIGSFDLADLLLGMAHGLLGKDMIMHHAVFVALSILSASTCFAGGRQPVCACVVLATEISTPALSYSLSMRNRLGEHHWSVKLSFLIFAVLFFIFRIGLYTVMLAYLSMNLHNFTPERFHGLIPLGFTLLFAGAILQYYWGVRILRILLKQVKAAFNVKAKSS